MTLLSVRLLALDHVGVDVDLFVVVSNGGSRVIVSEDIMKPAELRGIDFTYITLTLLLTCSNLSWTLCKPQMWKAS